MHQLSGRTIEMLIDKRIGELTYADSEDDLTNARYRIDGNFRVDSAEHKDSCDPNDPDPEAARAEARQDMAAGKIGRGDMTKDGSDKPNKAGTKAARDAADDPDPEAARAAMIESSTVAHDE